MTANALRRGPDAVHPWAGAVIISFSAVFVRLADVEAARSSFLRVAYALPILAVAVMVARRRSQVLRGPVLVPLAVVAGMFLGLDLFAWHASIGLIGAGLGTVLPNLQVVFVGVVGVALFGERPRPAFWYALPVVLAGVWLLSAVGEAVTVEDRVGWGVALGVVTAVFYTAFLVLLRVARLRRPHAGALEVLLSATLGASVTTGIAALVEGVAAPAGRLPADAWLVALALGSQVIGWLLLTSSIHRLPAALTSVVLLLQPVLAMLWGALLLGEPLGFVQVVGAGVVLVSVAVAHRAVVLGAAGARGPRRRSSARLG